MGYGIIISLDDAAVRRDPDLELLARGLADVVGTDSYPSRGLDPITTGPWQRLGAWHSNDMVTITIEADGARVVPGPSGTGRDRRTPVERAEWAATDPQQWASRIDSRTHREAYRQTSRSHRSTQIQALNAAGRDPRDALYGPDRVRGRGRRSLWWVHADTLNFGFAATAAATAVYTALDDRFAGEIRLGSHIAGMCRAGVLIGAGPVTVVWSGNRICLPEELTSSETGTLTSRLGWSVNP
jgi:hypothetical protein